LMIGVPDFIATEPTFVIVIVEPVRAAGPTFLSRAQAARALSAAVPAYKQKRGGIRPSSPFRFAK